MTTFKELTKKYNCTAKCQSLLERLDMVKEKFEQFSNKHQIDEHYGLDFDFLYGDFTWKPKLTQKRTIQEHLVTNHELIEELKNLSDEDFNKVMATMESDLLKAFAYHIVNVIGRAIYYNCLFKIDQLRNVNQDFKETINYKDEDITISKTYDYFVMNYKDYLCVHYFKNDRMFSFANPSLKTNEIECLKDFEKQVEKDVEFLIEFLNS